MLAIINGGENGDNPSLGNEAASNARRHFCVLGAGLAFKRDVKKRSCLPRRARLTTYLEMGVAWTRRRASARIEVLGQKRQQREFASMRLWGSHTIQHKGTDSRNQSRRRWSSLAKATVGGWVGCWGVSSTSVQSSLSQSKRGLANPP